MSEYEFSTTRGAYKVQLMAHIEREGVRPELWDIDEIYKYTRNFRKYSAAEAYAIRLSAAHPEAVQIELVDLGCIVSPENRRVYIKGVYDPLLQ